MGFEQTESTEQLYQEALERAAELGEDFNLRSRALGYEEAELRDLHGDDDDGESEIDESLKGEREAIQQLADRLDEEMAKRVKLLHQLGTRPIEDAFPRLGASREKLRQVERDTERVFQEMPLDQDFNRAKLERRESALAALASRKKGAELSEEELGKLQAAKTDLVRDIGFEVVDRPRSHSFDVQSGDLVLRKDGVVFRVRTSLLPSQSGLAAGSRVKALWAESILPDAGQRVYFDYDSEGLINACEDSGVQKAIDTLVAALG